eukprot:GHUV01004981.1.p1 GENE.GHUV01004981.1~~GHUV01004981.1.p1  ORF type:complete len:738 (+),score=315.96 GHUV01004981.1:1211-3424(+)
MLLCSQVHLIDDVKYANLRLAGAAPAGDQLASCLASDAGLKYKGKEDTSFTLPVVDGEASLADLYVYKVPGGRSGHSTFYRLLFTLTPPYNTSTTKAPTHAADGPTAAPLLTDKLQLITTRSKCNEKSDALYADQPVKKVQAVGEGFAKILSELKEHVPEVPDDLASVTKVGHFQQLVRWVKRTSNTTVPHLFRPNDWTRSSQHVLTALLQDDTRQRLWFPSASGAGMVFDCQQGEVQLDSPASFVLMLNGKLVVRPLSQLAPGQLQDLLQKAEADWYAAGHPNWSVYECNDGGQQHAPADGVVGRAAGVTAAVAAKPEVVLARAALGAAFGHSMQSIARHKAVRKPAGTVVTSCSTVVAAGGAGSTACCSSAVTASAAVNLSVRSPTASAASGASAEPVQTAAALTASPTCSSASSGGADSMPALSLTGIEPPAATVTVLTPAAAPAEEAAAAVAGKRRLQLGSCGQQQPPRKKLCVEQQAQVAVETSAARLVMETAFPSKAYAVQGEAVAAVKLAAASPEVTDLPSSLQQPECEVQVQQKQMRAELQQVECEPRQKQLCAEVQPQQSQDSEDGESSEADGFLQMLCNGGSGDWSNWSDLEGDLTADMDAELETDSSLLRELMLQQQQQQQEKDAQHDADVLQMLYQSMSEDWCTELDVELGNNLGSSFYYELDPAVVAPQQQLQQAVGGDLMAIDDGLMSRLVSLSDLPDFSELCDAVCIQGLSQGMEQLPIALV